MQKVTDQLRQEPQGAEDADHRDPPAHVEQVRFHERLPDGLGVGLHDRRHLVGDVADGKEVVGQHPLGAQG